MIFTGVEPANSGVTIHCQAQQAAMHAAARLAAIPQMQLLQEPVAQPWPGEWHKWGH